jgi:GNAT superfamily N-acetyltransferase
MEELGFAPLTAVRWDDLEELFGERGASGGCWCMWWRLKRSEYEQQKGEGNRLALKEIVDSSEIPSILAYDAEGQPVGWCSVAPREHFPVLERSRVLKRIDDKPVWSIVCLFVGKPLRRKGLTVALIKAAVEYVRESGGKIVEGYPVEPRKDRMPDVFAWTGLARRSGKPGSGSS